MFWSDGLHIYSPVSSRIGLNSSKRNSAHKVEQSEQSNSPVHAGIIHCTAHTKTLKHSEH